MWLDFVMPDGMLELLGMLEVRVVTVFLSVCPVEYGGSGVNFIFTRHRVGQEHTLAQIS